VDVERVPRLILDTAQYEEQQFNAVNRPDYLQIPAKERAELAARIAAAMAGHDQ
jgi:predicted trehalose synthase